MSDRSGHSSRAAKPKRKRARAFPESTRYAPAARLQQVRTLLATMGGASVYDIAERLDCSVRTAIRLLRALEASGEPLYETVEGRRKLWRLTPSGQKESIRLTMQQMVSMFLTRKVFDFLDGTGFKEDIDAVFDQLEAALKRKDFMAAKNLDRKFFDVGEAAYKYEGRVDDVDQLVTALLKEEKLDVTYVAGRDGSKRSFVLLPYTLMVHKKGLYVVGIEEAVGELRSYALDGFKKLAWRKGDAFAYPVGYKPSSVVGLSFGIIRGPKTFVRIRFDARVAKFIKRRRWHKTQRIVARDDGDIEMTLTVEGVDELKSWIFSFGPRAEVLEPHTLRVQMQVECALMQTLYAQA